MTSGGRRTPFAARTLPDALIHARVVAIAQGLAIPAVEPLIALSVLVFGVLVIEDLAEYQERIARLLREIDLEPKQIMIEAKILEITLDG